MVNAIIKWCLENVFLMCIAMAVIVAGGLYALKQSHVDAMPDIGEKQVIVFADWPGLSSRALFEGREPQSALMALMTRDLKREE